MAQQTTENISPASNIAPTTTSDIAATQQTSSSISLTSNTALSVTSDIVVTLLKLLKHFINGEYRT